MRREQSTKLGGVYTYHLSRSHVRRIQMALQHKSQQTVITDDERQQSDQAYGASEALRWVLGDGPSLTDWLK